MTARLVNLKITFSLLSDAQRFALEVVKYVNPQKVEAKNLEEALMSGKLSEDVRILFFSAFVIGNADYRDV
jgi:hypothetical protein